MTKNSVKPQGNKRDEAFLIGGRIRSEKTRLAICTTDLYRHTVERLNVGIIARLSGYPSFPSSHLVEQ